MEFSHNQQQQPKAFPTSRTPVQSSSTTSTTTATTHEQEPYSSDPFAPNYRHICSWDEERKADWIATWPLPLRADFWELYESAEHAEFTRPLDQLHVLLRQRGLEDGFYRARHGRDVEVKGEEGETQTQTQPLDDSDAIYERAKKFLMDAGEGGELLDRANEIFRTAKLRAQVLRGGAALQGLLEAGDVAGYNWIRMNPELIEDIKDDTSGGPQDSGGGGGGGGKDAEVGAVM